MSLRKKIRDWNVRRLLHIYAWARTDYEEWELRVDTSDPRDKAKQADAIDQNRRDMSRVVNELYWSYGYREDMWHDVGDMQFYIWPSYEHVKDAITIGYKE